MSKKTDEKKKKAKKGNAHVLLKLVSILMLAALVVELFVPKYFDLGTTALVDGVILGGEGSLFDQLSALVQNALDGTVVLDIYLWLFGISAALFAVTTLLTLFSRKAAPRHFLIGSAIVFVLLLPYVVTNVIAPFILSQDIAGIKIDLAVVAFALALIGLIIEGLAAGKGKNFAPILSLIVLTAVAALTAAYNFFAIENGATLYASSTEFFNTTIADVLNGKELALPADTYVLLSYAAFGVLFLNIVFTALQIGTVKKTTAFTALRYFVLLAVTAAALVLTFTALSVEITSLQNFIIAAAAALVLFIIALIAKPHKKKDKKAKKEKKA